MIQDYNHGNKGDGVYCKRSSVLSFLPLPTDRIEYPAFQVLFIVGPARYNV